MTIRKLDFLSRRQVHAQIFLTFDEHAQRIAQRLPEGYVYDHGLYRFPAGFLESYVVNAKEYNVDGSRSLEEQRALIAQDLEREGFSRDEIEDLIGEMEIKEGRPLMLDYTASKPWLKRHPEFRDQAMQVLVEVKKEVLSEVQSERNRRPGRR